MGKILKYLEFNEAFTVYSDPMYGGDVFRIRYRAIDDLSNKRGSDLPPKPVNDVLDGFQEGDIVRGKDLIDGEYKSGTIVSIEKDERGENVGISIEIDGEIIELAPATVTFEEGGDRGNIKPSPIDTPNQAAIDIANSNTFVPTTYESMRYIKKL